MSERHKQEAKMCVSADEIVYRCQKCDAINTITPAMGTDHKLYEAEQYIRELEAKLDEYGTPELLKLLDQRIRELEEALEKIAAWWPGDWAEIAKKALSREDI